MRHSPLMQLMAQSLNGDDTDAGTLPTPEAQADLLNDFLGEFTAQAASLVVGDQVVRNRFGEAKYRAPRDGQLARVSQVFDRPMLDEDGRTVHGEIAVVMEKGRVGTFSVDFRYYSRAK